MHEELHLSSIALAAVAWYSMLLIIIFLFLFYPLTLQCFDAVGWAAGRASSL